MSSQDNRPASLGDLVKRVGESIGYQVEMVKIDFFEEVFCAMDEQGVSKSELARRLGCKRANITTLLSGQGAPTLTTMVKLARALGCRLEIALVRDEGAGG